MAPGNISNRPQQTSALTIEKEYQIGRPQSPFVVQPPQPVGVELEVYEEVLGTRDFMEQDETGSDPGRVTILSIPAITTQLMAAEEVLGVRDQIVHEESASVIGNLIERGGV